MKKLLLIIISIFSINILLDASHGGITGDIKTTEKAIKAFAEGRISSGLGELQTAIVNFKQKAICTAKSLADQELFYNWKATGPFTLNINKKSKQVNPTKIGFSFYNKYNPGKEEDKKSQYVTVIVSHDDFPRTKTSEAKGLVDTFVKGIRSLGEFFGATTPRIIQQVPYGRVFDLELDTSKPTKLAVLYNCQGTKCEINEYVFTPGKTIYVSFGTPQAIDKQRPTLMRMGQTMPPYLYPQTGFGSGWLSVTDRCYSQYRNVGYDNIQKR